MAARAASSTSPARLGRRLSTGSLSSPADSGPNAAAKAEERPKTRSSLPSNTLAPNGHRENKQPLGRRYSAPGVSPQMQSQRLEHATHEKSAASQPRRQPPGQAARDRGAAVQVPSQHPGQAAREGSTTGQPQAQPPGHTSMDGNTSAQPRIAAQGFAARARQPASKSQSALDDGEPTSSGAVSAKQGSAPVVPKSSLAARNGSSRRASDAQKRRSVQFADIDPKASPAEERFPPTANAPQAVVESRVASRSSGKAVASRPSTGSARPVVEQHDSEASGSNSDDSDAVPRAKPVKAAARQPHPSKSQPESDGSGDSAIEERFAIFRAVGDASSNSESSPDLHGGVSKLWPKDKASTSDPPRSVSDADQGPRPTAPSLGRYFRKHPADSDSDSDDERYWRAKSPKPRNSSSSSEDSPVLRTGRSHDDPAASRSSAAGIPRVEAKPSTPDFQSTLDTTGFDREAIDQPSPGGGAPPIGSPRRGSNEAIAWVGRDNLVVTKLETQSDATSPVASPRLAGFDADDALGISPGATASSADDGVQRQGLRSADQATADCILSPASSPAKTSGIAVGTPDRCSLNAAAGATAAGESISHASALLASGGGEQFLRIVRQGDESEYALTFQFKGEFSDGEEFRAEMLREFRQRNFPSDCRLKTRCGDGGIIAEVRSSLAPMQEIIGKVVATSHTERRNGRPAVSLIVMGSPATIMDPAREADDALGWPQSPPSELACMMEKSSDDAAPSDATTSAPAEVSTPARSVDEASHGEFAGQHAAPVQVSGPASESEALSELRAQLRELELRQSEALQALEDERQTHARDVHRCLATVAELNLIHAETLEKERKQHQEQVSHLHDELRVLQMDLDHLRSSHSVELTPAGQELSEAQASSPSLGLPVDETGSPDAAASTSSPTPRPPLSWCTSCTVGKLEDVDEDAVLKSAVQADKAEAVFQTLSAQQQMLLAMMEQQDAALKSLVQLPALQADATQSKAHEALHAFAERQQGLDSPLKKQDEVLKSLVELQAAPAEEAGTQQLLSALSEQQQVVLARLEQQDEALKSLATLPSVGVKEEVSRAQQSLDRFSAQQQDCVRGLEQQDAVLMSIVQLQTEQAQTPAAQDLYKSFAEQQQLLLATLEKQDDALGSLVRSSAASQADPAPMQHEFRAVSDQQHSLLSKLEQQCAVLKSLLQLPLAADSGTSQAHEVLKDLSVWQNRLLTKVKKHGDALGSLVQPPARDACTAEPPASLAAPEPQQADPAQSHRAFSAFGEQQQQLLAKLEKQDEVLLSLVHHHALQADVVGAHAQKVCHAFCEQQQVLVSRLEQQDEVLKSLVQLQSAQTDKTQMQEVLSTFSEQQQMLLTRLEKQDDALNSLVKLRKADKSQAYDVICSVAQQQRLVLAKLEQQDEVLKSLTQQQAVQAEKAQSQVFSAVSEQQQLLLTRLEQQEEVLKSLLLASPLKAARDDDEEATLSPSTWRVAPEACCPTQSEPLPWPNPPPRSQDESIETDGVRRYHAAPGTPEPFPPAGGVCVGRLEAALPDLQSQEENPSAVGDSPTICDEELQLTNGSCREDLARLIEEVEADAKEPEEAEEQRAVEEVAEEAVEAAEGWREHGVRTWSCPEPPRGFPCKPGSALHSARSYPSAQHTARSSTEALSARSGPAVSAESVSDTPAGSATLAPYQPPSGTSIATGHAARAAANLVPKLTYLPPPGGARPISSPASTAPSTRPSMPPPSIVLHTPHQPSPPQSTADATAAPLITPLRPSAATPPAPMGMTPTVAPTVRRLAEPIARHPGVVVTTTLGPAIPVPTSSRHRSATPVGQVDDGRGRSLSPTKVQDASVYLHPQQSPIGWESVSPMQLVMSPGISTSTRTSPMRGGQHTPTSSGFSPAGQQWNALGPTTSPASVLPVGRAGALSVPKLRGPAAAGVPSLQTCWVKSPLGSHPFLHAAGIAAVRCPLEDSAHIAASASHLHVATPPVPVQTTIASEERSAIPRYVSTTPPFAQQFAQPPVGYPAPGISRCRSAGAIGMGWSIPAAKVDNFDDRGSQTLQAHM